MKQKLGVTTIEEARCFVFEKKICTILSDKNKDVPSLWEAVALPDKQPGEKGWGQKMVAVWTWKTELPAQYPKEIFYGKMRGGIAVLMTMEHLIRKHYPENFRELRDCGDLAQKIYELIRLDRYATKDLRRESMDRFGCTKSRFDSALKELQVTMNFVRSNVP